MQTKSIEETGAFGRIYHEKRWSAVHRLGLHTQAQKQKRAEGGARKCTEKMKAL
jgi:hypothetical protein